VSLLQTRHSALTDDDGEFEIGAVGTGGYQLVARAKDCQPLQLPDLQVEPDRVLLLARSDSSGSTIRPGWRLTSSRIARHDAIPSIAAKANFGPRTAGSNLDLARRKTTRCPSTSTTATRSLAVAS
jgi:hypothetical protein